MIGWHASTSTKNQLMQQLAPTRVWRRRHQRIITINGIMPIWPSFCCVTWYNLEHWLKQQLLFMDSANQPAVRIVIERSRSRATNTRYRPRMETSQLAICAPSASASASASTQTQLNRMEPNRGRREHFAMSFIQWQSRPLFYFLSSQEKSSETYYIKLPVPRRA